MAVQTRSTIKNWFRRGLKPLENQFADWVDSYWHKNDTDIPISSIDGLQDALDAKADANLVRPEYLQLNAGTDNSFIMNTMYKLVSLAIKNHSITDMNLIFTRDSDASEVLTVDIAAGTESDNFLNITFWTQDIINIAGITGNVAILIDRK